MRTYSVDHTKVIRILLGACYGKPRKVGRGSSLKDEHVCPYMTTQPHGGRAMWPAESMNTLFYLVHLCDKVVFNSYSASHDN